MRRFLPGQKRYYLAGLLLLALSASGYVGVLAQQSGQPGAKIRLAPSENGDVSLQSPAQILQMAQQLASQQAARRKPAAGQVGTRLPIRNIVLTATDAPAPKTGVKTRQTKPEEVALREATAKQPADAKQAATDQKAGDKKTDSKKAGDKNRKPKTAKKHRRKRTAYKRSGICSDLDRLAAKYKLPPLFFARLIWRESRFNTNAVSPAGAEGIAQFMPGTAAIWGLDDPFEPGQALLKSAQYLSWLRKKLGNLGLAAAGYNAGSQRVADWMAGNSYMPLETRNYVYAITGYTVEEWAANKAEFVGVKLKRKLPVSACKQLAIALKRDRGHVVSISYPTYGGKGKKRRRIRRRRIPPPPWGVQLAGSFKRYVAMKQFRSVKRKYGKIIGSRRVVLKSSRQGGRGRRIFHRVRVGLKTRAAAQSLCARLKRAGGSCVVMRN